VSWQLIVIMYSSIPLLALNRGILQQLLVPAVLLSSLAVSLGFPAGASQISAQEASISSACLRDIRRFAEDGPRCSECTLERRRAHCVLHGGSLSRKLS